MSSSSPRHVVILGATGSVGESAAAVTRMLPEEITLVGLSGYNNQTRLFELAKEFQPLALCTKEAQGAQLLREQLCILEKSCLVFHGEEGLLSLATLPEADIVLVTISGTGGLQPALAALNAGKDLAVASKEILVMAGEEIMTTATTNQCRILPVDSEHSAIFQCMEGRDPSTIRRLILTCSGGPFRKKTATELLKVTPEMALCHPTWSMGRKITIDSATLFNKGLEMIEAHFLFNIPMEKIEVVIHPESIIHSMVEFIDGSILAQMSHNSMTLPVQYAFTYPRRVTGPCPYLDLPSIGHFTFETPRYDVFPTLDLARRAGTVGGTLPAVLNAANEAAVELFLTGQITFPEIWQKVEHVMDTVPLVEHPSLEEILAADKAARKAIAELV
ncbi:MAG: 1-deoxy-D-xylulose-5-phosphate reductoisomerase [Verrucomicrobia bacterium RIFCSPHIGHO2_12_FULL_41_10]|nr:MAG: 1-deoxy-D-xylulose-5-phosphate reductoisomerase [Verrucomicrobia bacterium RIFCSPHIGHO2_12_FULL_41_10]HLB34773.1 1-deoxy-D-xylulose-5-phosphate reductoisomerase [Chthoniobacterales bacterium]